MRRSTSRIWWVRDAGSGVAWEEDSVWGTFRSTFRDRFGSDYLARQFGVTGEVRPARCGQASTAQQALCREHKALAAMRWQRMPVLSPP